MDKAWHLRQDGRAFPVKVHIYCMGDEDLSSEAEAASFILKSDSEDSGIAKYVLDAWMALLIEQEIRYDATEDDIRTLIIRELHNLPYKFQYALKESELLDIHKELGNYHDIDSFYSFTDRVKSDIHDIQENIMRSLNQQFCRVRYGGQYNSVSGNGEIWFRISSVDYNWANTIYKFSSDLYKSYKLSSITICRDSESDNGFDSNKEEFYKAADGVAYEHMPIEEFFREEHEHRMYFESNMCSGVIHTFRSYLKAGKTYEQAMNLINEEEILISRDMWNYLKKKEISRCIEGFSAPHRKGS